ncbi:hypothetical protein [Candidatus Odyssella thessalonicensis]|uniref:hypothetical protein n=1 Tax=Candidatus Odyssella thessalonicensis TaxID=84647 RepID=UPI000225ACAB|nr:hypothetical protein [Candidatus Odyssella thessalonicensis]
MGLNVAARTYKAANATVHGKADKDLKNAACAAFAAGRDVDIAIRSATNAVNAVENNFLTSTSPGDLFAEVLKKNLQVLCLLCF